ncbi:MAG: DUF1592 domain-containing protein [Rubritalea sp.]
MKHRTLFACWIICLFSALPAVAQPPSKIPHAIQLPKEQLEPFLKEHCFKCHGPKKQKGQVRFDLGNWVIDNNDSAQRWQDVMDQLNGGDMPPEEEDQPSNEELTTILKTLAGSVNEAKKRLTDHGGEIKMRRLNKREYSNTIKDLFGFEVDPNDIPADGEITTFDTVGAEQFFTSAHFESYLGLGRKIAKTSLNLNTKPHRKLKKNRTHPENNVTAKMRNSLADKDRKMAMKKAGKTWKEMGFKDEGDMKILFRQWDSRAELPRAYLQYPLINTGVYISDVAKWVSAAEHIDIRAEYTVRVHGGVVGNPHELRRIVRLWNDRIHGTLKIAGTPEKPESVSLRIRRPLGKGMIAFKVRENQPDHTINTMRNYLRKLGDMGKHTEPRASIWVDWLEIEGPFYPKKRPEIEHLLYPNKPTGGASALYGDDKSALEFIKKFTTISFRRKHPGARYINALHAKFKENRAAGVNYKSAMEEVIAVILASPSFLFIQEAVPSQDKPHDLLSNRELAIRLSYFLWSSPPDDQLYAANLADNKEYLAQVDRLLADPRSKAFRDGFIDQWAELDRYDAITVDRKKHFFFNQGVQADARKEVRKFFGVLIKENLPVANFIDSDFVTINGALAAHYGIPGVNPRDDSFQKVKLPATSTRGGLLTQAAFLTTGSNGERSSPVIRGALVLEKILHDKPPPPPPNVPELDEASSEPMSNKQLVLLHQDRAACTSCHKEMDVIGFGLENFDPVGRWRTKEEVGKKSLLINPSGILPSGEKFNDVNQLKKLLLKHEDKLAKELVTSILTYALGRTVEFSDRDDVEAIVTALKEKNYRTRDLIRAVAASRLIRKP